MWQDTPDQQDRRSRSLDNSVLKNNDVVTDLKNTFAAILQYKAWVIITTVLCLFLGIVFILLVDPLYRGTNQIFIDPRSKSLVENEIVPTGLGRSSIGGDLILLDSQIEIIRSDTVLRSVLEQERANGFTPSPQSVGLVKGLSNFLKSLTTTEQRDVSDDLAEELRQLRKALWVTRLSNSYVVAINVRSNDPERAARLANMIASTYIEQQSANRSSATRETTTSLNSRVEALREEVREAEANVEAYRAETGLIGADGRLIDDDQLRDLNNRVVAAKAETSVARARAESLKSASISDVLAGSSSEALTSQVVSNIRLQLANLTRRESEALAQFGERHPSLAALRSEREGINTLLQEELQRIIKAAENNLEVALTNERFVQEQFDELTRSSIANQKALVRLRELEREAASSRAVLEGFLVRAKESDEQEELSNDSTRVISDASIPTIAFFPKKRLVLAASLFAGLSLGTLFAWLRALFAVPASASKMTDRRRAPHQPQMQPQVPRQKTYQAEQFQQQAAQQQAPQHQPVTPQTPRHIPSSAETYNHFESDDQWQENIRDVARTNYDYAPPQQPNSQPAPTNNFTPPRRRNKEHQAPRASTQDNLAAQSKRLFARLKKHAYEERQQQPQPDQLYYSEPPRAPTNYRESVYRDQFHEPQKQSAAQNWHSREPRDYEPTIEEKTSSLSEAIHALLPKSTNYKGHKNRSQSPPYSNQQPSYPEHLVDAVQPRPARDPIGLGGQLYGNNHDRSLSNLIAKIGDDKHHLSPQEPYPSPPGPNVNSTYPRSRARDLLRKLGR